jgi:flagellar motor switch protein FliG
MLAGCSLVGMVFGAGAFSIWSARRASERERLSGEMSEEEIAARAGDTEPVEEWEADPKLREARAWALIGDARAEDVSAALALESPEAIASALLQLSERVPGSMAMAGKVLRLLPEDCRVEVVNALASGEVSEDVPGLAERLADGVEEQRQRSQRRLRGARLAAAVLEAGNEQVRGGVLRALAERDPSLVEAIRGPGSFDDLVGLDDETLVAVLQRAQESDLVLALWSSEADVRERFFRLMPASSSKRLRQRVGELRAVRVGEIEGARARLRALARQGWPGQGGVETERYGAFGQEAVVSEDASAQVVVLEGR